MSILIPSLFFYSCSFIVFFTNAILMLIIFEISNHLYPENPLSILQSKSESKLPTTVKTVSNDHFLTNTKSE